MSSQVNAPFSEDQVKSLNEYQTSGCFHEFTCGNTKCRDALVASETGWKCPTCGFDDQKWAWSWMTDWRWKELYVPKLKEDDESLYTEEE